MRSLRFVGFCSPVLSLGALPLNCEFQRCDLKPFAQISMRRRKKEQDGQKVASSEVTSSSACGSAGVAHSGGGRGRGHGHGGRKAKAARCAVCPEYDYARFDSTYVTAEFKAKVLRLGLPGVACMEDLLQYTQPQMLLRLKDRVVRVQ